MWRRPAGLSILTVLSTWFAGCSLVNPPDTQMSMDELKELEAHFVDSGGIAITPDPSQLKAGQHVKILMGNPPETLSQEIRLLTSGIAGTVKEVSADRVVLQDVVMISSKPTQQGIPIVSKLPFSGRLFTNTGVRREVTPVPGEVTIELSKILEAKVLTDTAFEDVRKYGAERIGVDFDFSAEQTDPETGAVSGWYFPDSSI